MAQKKRTSVSIRESRYVQGGDTYVKPERLGWWERELIEQSTDDIFITITPEYARRPDKVAKDLYQKPTLMWLVLQYNNIVDIELEFVEGKEIRLPSPSRVSLSIINKKTGGIPE